MKRLNNKGLTLMELLISIVLLSIVMLAAERIINQLVFIKKNGNIAVDNIITRSTIIDTIQNDLVAYGLANPNDETSVIEITKEEDSFTFILTSYKGQSSIKVRENDITYTDFSGRERLWELKNCHSSINLEEYAGAYYSTLDNYILVNIHIPIFTLSQFNNEYNNNINDDIIITYYGKYLEL